MDLVLNRRDEILRHAALDCQYYTYIITASCIATAGLVMDNSEVIVASMLISPIMNHVNAITFGALLWDKHMVQVGLIGILVGIFVAFVVGSIGGLYFSATMVLTNEMTSRTVFLNLKWSFVVAFFSALAAGVSILQEHIYNMIGVAISTSVLPPLANFGLLLPNAIMARPNRVSVHACLLSLAMALGNMAIIFLTSCGVIYLYVRLPSRSSWRLGIQIHRQT